MMMHRLISNLLGLIGAAIGGVVGFYTFGWLYDHGFYGLAIPGSLLGLGCGLLARHRSTARGVVCGAAALALSLFTEWWFRPFVADRSITYMLRHVQELSPVTWLMTAIATVVGFWIGQDAGFGLTPWSRSYRAAEAKAEGPGGEFR
jgi:hypothetical protein